MTIGQSSGYWNVMEEYRRRLVEADAARRDADIQEAIHIALARDLNNLNRDVAWPQSFKDTPELVDYAKTLNAVKLHIRDAVSRRIPFVGLDFTSWSIVPRHVWRELYDEACSWQLLGNSEQLLPRAERDREYFMWGIHE